MNHRDLSVDYFYEAQLPVYNRSDFNITTSQWYIFCAIWLVFFGIGLLLVSKLEMYLLGAVVLGVPSFLLMVIKPTFALAILMSVVPIGEGLGFIEVFTLNKMVGIVVAISFFINALITRPRLKFNKVLVAFLLYTFFVCIAPLWAPFPMFELLSPTLSQVQILILMFMIYWIIVSNDIRTLIWGLRGYVAGTILSVVLAFLSGAAIESMEEYMQGRYSTVMGTTIDANMLGAMISLSVLSSYYLVLHDKHFFWKVFSIVGCGVSVVMVFKIGSRGALLSLFAALGMQIFIIKEFFRDPRRTFIVLSMFVLLLLFLLIFFIKGNMGEGVHERLTDLNDAKDAIAFRWSVNVKAVEMVAKHPLGTTDSGWRIEVGHMHPHSDFFYALGMNGVLAAGCYVLFVLFLVQTVFRMPEGNEKMFAVMVVIFLIIMGFDIVQLRKKYLWLFFAVALALSDLCKNMQDNFFVTEHNENFL